MEIGEAGQPYSLSQDDINFILNQGQTFFKKTEESFLKAALEVLSCSKYSNEDGTPLSAAIENRLVSWLKK